MLKKLKFSAYTFSFYHISLLLGALILLLAIPVITLNLGRVRQESAKAVVAPSAANCPTRPGAGDVDLDGFVTATDSLKILRYVSKLESLSSGQLIRANVNDDVVVDSVDAHLILRYVSKTDKYLPVCIDHDKDNYSDNAEAYIGTDPYDNCPDSSTDKAWPPDFDNNGKIEQKDIDTYSTPVRRLNTSPGDSGFDVRWDVIPGTGGFFTAYINISDVTKAFGGKVGTVCTQGVKPTITPASSQLNIYAGDDMQFGWSANNANPPCTASGDWSGQQEVSGSFSSKATQIKTYSFTLKCYGTEGWAQASYDFNAQNPSPDKIQNGKLYATGGAVFVIQDYQKRRVESPAVMDKCRYDWGAVITGSIVDKYLPYVPVGPNVSLSSDCPEAPTRAIICSGTLVFAVNGQSSGTIGVQQNSQVSFSAFGLSNCSGRDTVKFQAAVNTPSFSTILATCTLNNGSSCSTNYTANLNPGTYELLAFLDINNDGSTESYSTLHALYLQVLPPGPSYPDGNRSGSIEDILAYIDEVAGNQTESYTGLNAAHVMKQIMWQESGGNICAVGSGGEIGIFQYLPGTWGGTGQATAKADYGSRYGACWRNPGEDTGAYANYFGWNIDADAWNPYAQIRATAYKITHYGACAWTAFDLLFDTREIWCPYSRY